MVLVTPPEGWVDEIAVPAPTAQNSSETTLPPSKNGDSSIGRLVPPPARETPSEKPELNAPPVQQPPLQHPPMSLLANAANGKAIGAASPLAEGTQAAPPIAATVAAIAAGGFTPFEQPEVVVGETFLSALTKSVWGRVAVLAVSGLLGLAGVLVVCTLLSKRHATTDTEGNDETARPANPALIDPNVKSTSAQFNRRWLPHQTQLLVDLRLSRLAKQPPALDSLEMLGPWWQASNKQLLEDLHLGPEQVRRMTWATTDLSDCAAHSVVVIELEEGNSAVIQIRDLAGDPVDLGTNFFARHLAGAKWLHPVIAVDAHTIVTGREEELRQLLARGGEAELASPAMEALLKHLSTSGDLAVMLDLSAMRTRADAQNATWMPPADWLDVWPAGKPSWHVLCETKLAALGLSVQSADDHHCELGLVCGDEAAAANIQSDVKKLASAAIQTLPSHIASLDKTLKSRNVAAAGAEQYKKVLNDLLAALNVARCDTSDGIVWLRSGWGPAGLLASAAWVMDNRAAPSADWLAAARTADEAEHRRLLKGLLGYVKDQSPPRFPDGAAGDVLLLKPDNRLSWIAGLLPYLGHADWRVEPGYGWNDSHNNAIVRRPLEEVTNPALGPGLSASGYPATNYVGAAGLGKDAALSQADRDHAGVFGYGRQTRQQDLVRGGANTIAILGVQDHLGAWAQGGAGTVRALTQRPYVNGPDGFGSGQPNGMVVGMADASARFVSDKIDPEILEKMVVVGRGSEVDLAALDSDGTEGRARPPVIPPNPSPVAEVKQPAVVERPPEPIDPKLQAMLDVPIAKIVLPKVPLAEAVRIVSAVGNLPVSFDPDAMQELGVTLRDPISVEAGGTSAGKALEAIAADRRMTTVIEHGQALLTSPADHRIGLRPESYNVANLTGGKRQAAEQLAALIQKLVAPGSWATAGGRGMGRGTIEVSPDALLIRQTGQVHYQIVTFCEKLRVARGLPTLNQTDPKRFLLVTRSTRAKAVLGHSMSLLLTANAPATLGGVVDRFQQAANCEILIDGPALASVGISKSQAMAFRPERLPLAEALEKLLGPLGLACRVVDANTLQVTTQKAVEERMELEFYPLGGLLAGRPSGPFIEQLQSGVPGALWGEGVGATYFDPLSQCLIVLQSQPVQAAIEGMLAK
jgi:hypothetical protein